MIVEVTCPSCGEPTDVHVDEVGGQYVEDCVVCCRPMDVRVRVDDDGEATVEVAALDG